MNIIDQVLSLFKKPQPQIIVTSNRSYGWDVADPAPNKNTPAYTGKLLISAQQLKLFAPGCDYEYIAPELNNACNQFGITSNRQIRHFMAHLDVESVHFTHYEENLRYSNPERLCAVWPSRFPTVHDALAYTRNPEALANKVYGGRMGNNAVGDGWKYRGRGFIQLTGKDNYVAASKAIAMDLVGNPDLLLHNKAAALVAAWFWKKNGLNEIVAKDADEQTLSDAIQQAKVWEDDDLVKGTKAINGGLIGIEDRRFSLYKAAGIWKD